MELSQLIAVLPDARVRGSLDVSIGKIVSDSRHAGAGDLFVAIRGGEEVDRHEFVADAVARKVGAVVVEDEINTGDTTRITVENCRVAAAKLAARFHDHPDRKLLMVGITGTNGKTTTAFLVRNLLEAAGKACGYLGTLGLRVGDKLQPVANTTPEAAQLHEHLRSMVEAGNQAAVLEVSSHALALDRVGSVSFDLGLFTNLSRDHLDFHRTLENYLEAKAKLFESLESGGVAVVNKDDPAGAAIAGRVRGRTLTYGFLDGADVRAQRVQTGGTGTVLQLEWQGKRFEIETQLTGKFNCYNVLAAVTCGIALGVESEPIRRGIAALESVPGRFERIRCGQKFEVIVDYAHTPAALDTVLRTARDLTHGRVICLFGCGGDRDRGKRPQMGRVATDLADLSFITSDNPRSERPESIIEDILVGVENRDIVTISVDRRAAMRDAFSVAGADDLVVIAGKGHESGQELADRTIPFDDRQVARDLMREMGADD